MSNVCTHYTVLFKDNDGGVNRNMVLIQTPISKSIGLLKFSKLFLALCSLG